MELNKRERKIKYLVYFGILALCALLQNVDGLWLQIGSARCFLLLPASVLLCVGEDEKLAIGLGLFAGVLWDIVSSNSVGFNAIFLMVACYFISLLISHILRPTFWVSVVSSVIVTLLYVVTYWLVFVVSKSGDGANLTLWTFYAPSFIYTSIIAFLMNLAFVPLKKKLNKE